MKEHGPPSLDDRGPTAPLWIAHRGAALLYPENTLEAYRAAYASGLRVLEQDVRLLGDGGLAVMHDASVDRMTHGRGRVRDFDRRSWKGLEVDTEAWPAFASQTIAPALLDEVLEEFRDRVLFVPEAKDVGGGAPLVAALQRAGIATAHAIVQSFLLDELRPAIDAGYPAMFLTETAADIAAVRASGAGWVGVDCTARDGVFAAWIAAGFKVVAWTVDDRRVRDRLLALGVSGFFSDDPLSLMR